jgi:hypothetical protein
MYNLSNLTEGNTSGFVDVLAVSNDVTNGFYWLFVSIALWIVLAAAMHRTGVLPAIVASSFITGVVGILLVITGLVGSNYLIYYILIIALGTAAAFVAGKGEG